MTALLASGCGLASLTSAGIGGDGGGYDAGGMDVAADGATLTPDAGVLPPKGNTLCHDDPSTCMPDKAGCALPEDAGVSSTADAGDAGPGSACRVMLGDASTAAPVCGVAGQNQDGEPCTTGDDCAAGFECVGSPGRCRHYCCDSSACATLDNGNTLKKHFCDVASEAEHTNVKVPVCQVVQPCTLLAGGCDQGFTCALVDINDGTTSCVPLGPAKAGQECGAEHCGRDLSCIGEGQAATCQQLCDNYHPCPGDQQCMSSWPSLKQLGVGICQ